MTVAGTILACAMASYLGTGPVLVEPPSQAVETGQSTLSLEDLDALLEGDDLEENLEKLLENDN